MCLHIKEKKFIAVEDVSKLLYKSKGNRYITPHMGTAIKSTGWLLPKVHKKEIPKYKTNWFDARIRHEDGTTIYEGVIHAFRSKKPNSRRKHVGIAVHTEFIGRHNDLVCRALYLPNQDNNIQRSLKTLSILRGCPKGRKESKEYLLYHFPFLKGYLF